MREPRAGCRPHGSCQVGLDLRRPGSQRLCTAHLVPLKSHRPLQWDGHLAPGHPTPKGAPGLSEPWALPSAGQRPRVPGSTCPAALRAKTKSWSCARHCSGVIHSAPTPTPGDRPVLCPHFTGAMLCILTAGRQPACALCFSEWTRHSPEPIRCGVTGAGAAREGATLTDLTSRPPCSSALESEKPPAVWTRQLSTSGQRIGASEDALARGRPPLHALLASPLRHGQYWPVQGWLHTLAG